MSSTNVVCGVKACRYYSTGGCTKKAVVLNLAGQCLSLEELTAAQEAAEGALMYGA